MVGLAGREKTDTPCKVEEKRREKEARVLGPSCLGKVTNALIVDNSSLMRTFPSGREEGGGEEESGKTRARQRKRKTQRKTRLLFPEMRTAGL